jgi:antitoxin HigA-1
MPRVPAHRAPTHPGRMLVEEFLKPMGMMPIRSSAHYAGVNYATMDERGNVDRSDYRRLKWRI